MKMISKKTILGIDSSNYTTSIALVDEDARIIADCRKLLNVKQGEKGLRQSDAVFQHMVNFPEIFINFLEELGAGDYELKEYANLCGICVSVRPRPQEESYMPCFRAGLSFAKVMARSLKLPLLEVSHQEGHIEAAIWGLEDIPDKFLAWHLSGGTCELLQVRKNFATDENAYEINIIGGSKDISIGQLIDRVGVKLGMSFPAGPQMDELASNSRNFDALFTKIKSEDLYFNLSGIETQVFRYIEKAINDGEELITVRQKVASELFYRICELLETVSLQAIKKLEINYMVFSGGVAGSSYIRKKFACIREESAKTGKYSMVFSDRGLSSDNAVGVALLGKELLDAGN